MRVWVTKMDGRLKIKVTNTPTVNGNGTTSGVEPPEGIYYSPRTTLEVVAMECLPVDEYQEGVPVEVELFMAELPPQPE